MLVLEREVNEVILIGPDIRVVVCEVRGHRKVRIGVIAPRDVVVMREEVAKSVPVLREELLTKASAK